MPQSFDGNGAGGGGFVPREQLFPRVPFVATFALEFVYYSASIPLSDDIALDQTGAVLGVVQKVYHQVGLLDPAPVISGVTDIQRIGTGAYTSGVLNVIYFEWTETDRIEYWITQEG